MRASEIMVDYPAIDQAAAALEAVRMIGVDQRPAVLVLRDGKPETVLPGSQVLTFLIPGYLQEDPSLVKVYGEKAADAAAGRLTGKTVADLLPPRNKRPPMPSVDRDATVIECAAVMAALHSPLLVVCEEDGSLAGAITASRLLSVLVP